MSSSYTIVRKGGPTLSYAYKVVFAAYAVVAVIMWYVLSTLKPYIVQSTDAQGTPDGNIDSLFLVGAVLLYTGAIAGVICIFAIISRLAEKNL
jgi:hypothetical protein